MGLSVIIMEETKKNFRSILKQYISNDCFVDLYKVSLLNIPHVDKTHEVYRILRKYGVPFDGLGNGTNRCSILVDGAATKIALDVDGMIDNRREFKYVKELYPDTTKAYECTPNGLLSTFEYVRVMELDEFMKYESEIKRIIKSIANKGYLIGDIGFSTKNYTNWGVRNDGGICILDFAYIYKVSYKLFNCDCNKITTLRYDKNYVNLVCPACGKTYTFGDIRKRITKEQQELEIGDIRDIGYQMTSPSEVKIVVPMFDPVLSKPKKNKIKSPNQILLDKFKEEQKRIDKQYEEQGYDDGTNPFYNN